MELGQRTQHYAVFRQSAQNGRFGFPPRIFNEGLINYPEQVRARRQKGQAFFGLPEQARRIARVGQEDRRTAGRVKQGVRQGISVARLRRGSIQKVADTAPYPMDVQSGEAAGQRVFTEGRFHDVCTGHAAFPERTGKGVDDFIASVAEDEVGGGQAMTARGGFDGFFGMWRGVGRKVRCGPQESRPEGIPAFLRGGYSR